ncbi:DUF721 domain-containing protein [Crocinitomix catalasitica]|uniref:DUF721 domain-containing protein n=1 Tax=Crocinitomix catalasitica TaxID=184607 RepID=UPI0004857A07|nr:DUF721 domain-containing protein [Crocinitomix catalasitica]
MRKNEDGKPLKDVLDGFFKSMGMEDKMIETKALSQWTELMGEAVGKRTLNLFIKNRVLILELNSSVIRDELMHSKSNIIDKFNQMAGKDLIEDIFFK